MALEPGRPELYSTRTSSAWKVPALALAAVLAGVVVVTRLGGSDRPVAVIPQSSPSAGPTSTPGTVQVPALPDLSFPRTQTIPVSADGLTYVDGIPTFVDGVPVVRVHDALRIPVGRTELIGGWYRTPNCRASGLGTRCPSPTLSDVPLVPGRGDVRTEFVALDHRLSGTGGRIVLATTEQDPDCSIHLAGECQARLRVSSTVWSTSNLSSPADEDAQRLDVIAAVNSDPDHFAGAYLDEAGLFVVLYVDSVARATLAGSVDPGISVHWRKVDRSWSDLMRILSQVRDLNLGAVHAISLDTIGNRVKVFGDGLDAGDIRRLADEFGDAVVYVDTPPPVVH